VPNLNSANVSVYRVNAATGTLTPVAGSPFAAGTGPSSLALTRILQ
jgi:6-phosphogluconolactonase